MTESTPRAALLAYARENGLDPGLVDPGLVELKAAEAGQRAANAVARAIGDVPMRTVRAQWTRDKEETPGFPLSAFTYTVEIAAGADLVETAWRAVGAYWNDEGYSTRSDGELRTSANPGAGSWELLVVVEEDGLFVTVDSGPIATTTDPLAPTPKVPR